MKLWIGRPTSGLTLLLCTLAAELMELRGYSPLIHLIHVPLLVLVEFLTNRKDNKCGKSGQKTKEQDLIQRKIAIQWNLVNMDT